MPGVFLLAPGPVFLDPNKQTVHSNATVATSSSATFSGFGTREIVLVVNILNAPTGTSPTITYTLQELDPGDQTTAVGSSVTGTPLVAAGTQILTLALTLTGTVKVSWTVTGSTPSFTGVYATLVTKNTTPESGVDGSGVERTILVDSSGRPVITINSGSLTANQGSPNTLANAWPVELSDGTNLLGVSAHPVRVDPTGTTTQPVSGTVTAAQATAASLNATVTQGPGSGSAATFWYVRITDGTNTMPTGDAVGRAIFYKLTDGTNTASVSAASALKVDGSAVTQPISGTVTSNQGTGAAAGAPWSVELSDGASFYTGAKTGQFPSALVAGRLDVNAGSWLGSTAPTVGSKTSANSLPVVIASDQAAIPVSQSGTWTVQQGGSPWGVKTEVQIDYDTGVGTQNLSIIGLALPASGGAVAGGTSTNPLRTDPTGTTTQPVSGTVTANIGTSGSLALDATLTGGTQRTKVTDGTNDAAVKAASTAPIATDPALVVAISPNSSITATNPSVGSNNAAIPTSSTQVGGSDGTNLQAARVFDADTGAGTQYVLGTVLRKSASGGSVEAGTSSDPLRIDPTGTTTQPVSGTVTANIGSSGSLALDATLTGGTQRTKVTDGTNNAAVKAASTAAVAADPALVVAVSPNNTVGVTQATASNLNATVVQGAGSGAAGTFWYVRVTDGTNSLPTMDAVGRAGFQKVTDGTNTAAVKAASTAPIASDPALVVAISPNSSLTASNPSVGSNNAAIPTSSTQVGGSDGTNLQAARVFDADSGAGTQYVLGTVLRKSASGGSVEAGTSSDPLRVDPTGTTTQPVSGTVTANIGSSGSLALDATLTGGTQKAIVRGGAKGATVAADVTSTAEGSDHQALDIQVYHGGVAKDPTAIRPLTSSDVVTVVGAAANTTAASGNPVLTAGMDAGGLVETILAANDRSQVVTIGPNTQTLLANATVTVTGATTVRNIGARELTLIVNIKNAPTGSSPQITWQIYELDPGDQGTTLGQSVGGATMTAAGTQLLSLPLSRSGLLLVQWVVSGSSPSFTGVYASVCSKDQAPLILIDSNAVERQALSDTLGVQIVQSPGYGAASASISGAIAGHRFGFSSGNGTPQVLRATAYTEPSSAAQRSIASSNAADTSAGTGARQVTLTYYDNTMSGPNTEVVTLNGTSAVNTTNTNIRFIEKMEVTSVGSSGANVGTITLFGTTAGGGGVVGTIGVGNRATGIGDNVTFWAHHYVRTGKTMYLLGMSASMSDKTTGQTIGKATNPLVSTSPELQRTPGLGTKLAMMAYTFKVPILIAGPARFTMYNTSTGGGEVNSSFEFMEY